MKRIGMLVGCLIVSAMVLGGCSVSGEKAKDVFKYEISREEYNDNGIKIAYPQLKGSDDSKKESEVNELIKTEALGVLNDYVQDAEDFTLDIDYSVKFNNEKYLSIVYAGTGYVKDAAHPNNLFYTTNINLDKKEKMILKNMTKIDNELVKKLKSAEIKLATDDTSVKEGILAEANSYTDDEMIEYLNNADVMGENNGASAYSYFTNDKLGISLGLFAHAVGDHAEFEIPFKVSELK